MEVTNSLGRRKTATARVIIKPGQGSITIKGKDITTYFPTMMLQQVINEPLVVTNTVGQFDITANIDGGGVSGQAEALRMAISRALCEINPEYRPSLKSKGFLRRDSRMVERKKYGQPKARKKFQFSKR